MDIDISLKWLNTYLDRPISADEAERSLTNVGYPLAAVTPHGNDITLRVEITSNRPDLLCHVGIARELAAATDRRFIEPKIESDPLMGTDVHKLTSVTNHAVDLCPLYTARVITGVKVGPSPAWLVEALEAIGLRSVNNVVDVTNYVLHELGQPLHAFDLAKLAGRRIVIRRATAGETITAIDSSVHKLAPDMLVIADEQRPQAIAGVMGGRVSEVSSTTTDILIESAAFAPLSVRSTSRALKLASDSSRRFERKVDLAGVDRAARRCAALIRQVAGGAQAKGVIATGEQATDSQPKRVSFHPDRCRAILGVNVAAHDMIAILERLGLKPVFGDHGVITCTIPSYRLDLHREIDLIEEIARMHGFAQIPVHHKMAIVVRPPQKSVEARKTVNRVLTSYGYFETITFSFLPPKQAAAFAAGLDVVKVDEQKKKADPAIRPSVLPSLLACRKANQDAGNKDVRLFEIAQVFGKRDGKYAESRKLALLADAPNPAEQLRELRGAIEELLHAMGLRLHIGAAAQSPDWCSPAAQIVVGSPGEGEKVLGYYGPAIDAVTKLFDLQTPVILAELDYAVLTSHYPPQPRSSELPAFPAIQRDLSIEVDDALPWSRIESVVAEAKPALMEHVDFVTVYRGKPVPAGKKSVTMRMTFRDPARTLKHDEVSPQVQSLIEKLKTGVNAELRSSSS
jgi:phenylalanyl-tRNA synthetase beta chain